MSRPLLRSGGMMTAVNGLSILCSFARNIAIARIVGPSDFGVAAIILTMATAADLLSDLGWDRFLIQSKDHGRDAQTLATVHRMRLITGAAAGLLIAIAAPFVAMAIDVPEAGLPLAIVGLICIVRSFVHADFRLRQRAMDFNGEARVEGAKALTDFGIGIAAALILQSYWAMVLALGGGAVAALIVSHWVARAPYRQSWDAEAGQAAMRFGTPLLANNMVVFGSSHLDRLLIGSLLSTATLGTYAAGATIASGAQALINRTSMSVAMPYLAKAAREGTAYNAAFVRTGIVIGSAAAALVLGAALVGSAFISLLFGADFQPDPMMVAGIGLAGALNILRVWPSIGLMAQGRTRTIPLANIVRLAGPALAAVSLLKGQDVVTVTFCLVFGEACGFVSALMWHHRQSGLSWLTAFVAIMIATVFAVLAIGAMAWVPTDLVSRVGITAIGVVAIAGLALIALKSKQLSTVSP